MCLCAKIQHLCPIHILSQEKKKAHLRLGILLSLKGRGGSIAQAVVLLVLAVDLAGARVTVETAVATTTGSSTGTAGGAGSSTIAGSAVVAGSTGSWS